MHPTHHWSPPCAVANEKHELGFELTGFPGADKAYRVCLICGLLEWAHPWVPGTTAWAQVADDHFTRELPEFKFGR